MRPKPELKELVGDAAGEPLEPAPERAKESKKCGHVNKQSYGLDGKLDNLRCALEKGHSGDHFAKHEELHEGVELEAEAFWGDAAGEPA